MIINSITILLFQVQPLRNSFHGMGMEVLLHFITLCLYIYLYLLFMSKILQVLLSEIILIRYQLIFLLYLPSILLKTKKRKFYLHMQPLPRSNQLPNTTLMFQIVPLIEAIEIFLPLRKLNHNILNRISRLECEKRQLHKRRQERCFVRQISFENKCIAKSKIWTSIPFIFFRHFPPRKYLHTIQGLCILV